MLLILLQLTRLGFLVRSTIPDRPRQRMFLASVSFLLTFVGVRVLVWMIVYHEGPFQWVMVRGRHIHHLVWGILILLLVGYGWLMDLGYLQGFRNELLCGPTLSPNVQLTIANIKSMRNFGTLSVAYH